VTSFYKPEVLLTHLPVGLGESESVQEWDLLVLLFFVGELDVASGISGVDVVCKIPHLTLLYQFQNIVHIPLPKFWFAFNRCRRNSLLLQPFHKQIG